MGLAKIIVFVAILAYLISEANAHFRIKVGVITDNAPLGQRAQKLCRTTEEIKAAKVKAHKVGEEITINLEISAAHKGWCAAGIFDIGGTGKAVLVAQLPIMYDCCALRTYKFTMPNVKCEKCVFNFVGFATHNTPIEIYDDCYRFKLGGAEEAGSLAVPIMSVGGKKKKFSSSSKLQRRALSSTAKAFRDSFKKAYAPGTSFAIYDPIHIVDPNKHLEDFCSGGIFCGLEEYTATCENGCSVSEEVRAKRFLEEFERRGGETPMKPGETSKGDLVSVEDPGTMTDEENGSEEQKRNEDNEVDDSDTETGKKTISTSPRSKRSLNGGESLQNPTAPDQEIEVLPEEGDTEETKKAQADADADFVAEQIASTLPQYEVKAPEKGMKCSPDKKQFLIYSNGKWVPFKMAPGTMCVDTATSISIRAA